MPAKIFVSGGQATDDEREIAKKIAEAFKAEGFQVYLAIQAQSIEDINSGIIGHLRRSDYYVFIDYKRMSSTTPQAEPGQPPAA